MLVPLFVTIAQKRTQRDLERTVAKFIMAFGALLLTAIFDRQCAAETDAELEKHTLTTKDVVMRRDKDYWASMMSIYDPIRFCTHAFRATHPAFRSAGGSGIPAQTSFMPTYPACRSTVGCLEWESRLGADHPFRTAQDELQFFTHGKVTLLEDNTISRHMIACSNAVEQKWLYQTPADVRIMLEDRAMCDLKT